MPVVQGPAPSPATATVASSPLNTHRDVAECRIKKMQQFTADDYVSIRPASELVHVNWSTGVV